jgi:hypothetical protein
MSQSRRYWPPGLEEQLFIKMPHAAGQYKERAGLPPSYALDRAQEDLRRLICEALRSGEQIYPNTKGKGNPEKECVIRIHSEGLQPVWALLEEGAPDGKYKYMVHTVFDKSMFDKWNQGQKLGSIADVPGAEALKSVPTVPKPKPEPDPVHPDTSKLLVRWMNGDEDQEERWVDEIAVNGEVLMLIQQGVPLDAISVFRVELKKVKVGLSVKLEE